MFGLISFVLLITVAGIILGYIYKQQSQSALYPDAILIQIGGEGNQNNCLLDSHWTSREERAYDDTMDDIQAAMDEDVYEKSATVKYAVAWVISVEDYDSDEKKEVKFTLNQKIQNYDWIRIPNFVKIFFRSVMCPEFIPYCWAHLPVRQPLQLTKIPSLLFLHLSPQDG